MLVGCLAVGAVLGGCSGPAKSADPGGSYKVVHVDVGGRKVPCVLYSVQNKSAAISCDWAAR